jgi:hypothetical protein
LNGRDAYTSTWHQDPTLIPQRPVQRAVRDLEKSAGRREQVLEFFIAGVGNKRALQRGIDGLVVRYLVIDVGLVEVFPAELGEFGSLICRLFAQCLAGRVIFRRDAELFYQAASMSSWPAV